MIVWVKARISKDSNYLLRPHAFLAQGELAYAADVNAGAMVAADGSSTEWSEHLDDEGYTYYYSSLTEESQYECPY